MTAPAEEGSAFVPLLGLGLKFVAILHKSCLSATTNARI